MLPQRATLTNNTLAKSHLVSSHQTNVFKYLDDPNDASSEYNITVNAFTDFNESPHQNKKAFEITLQKDAGTNIIVQGWDSIYTLYLWVHIQ